MGRGAFLRMDVDLRHIFNHHRSTSGRLYSEQLQQLTLHAVVKCRTAATLDELDTLVQQAVSSPEFQSSGGWDFNTFDDWYTDFHRTHALGGTRTESNADADKEIASLKQRSMELKRELSSSQQMVMNLRQELEAKGGKSSEESSDKTNKMKAAIAGTNKELSTAQFTLLNMRERFREVLQVMGDMDEQEQDEENQEILSQMIERAQRAIDLEESCLPKACLPK